jgi:hypothetical protein
VPQIAHLVTPAKTHLAGSIHHGLYDSSTQWSIGGERVGFADSFVSSGEGFKPRFLGFLLRPAVGALWEQSAMLPSPLAVATSPRNVET